MIMNKTELLLNEGWKFHFGECEEAWYQGYDDRAFERVMLPHDWAVAYPFSKQYSSGTGYLTGGIGWYRLHFYLPEEYQGKAIRLVFDGVYKNSQVWVNSYYQGKHPYGYTGFSYDISGIAHFGEQENVVSVKVTHTDIADSRWYTGSGITRKVTLVVEEQVHPAEYGVTFVTEKLVADGKEFPEVQAAVSIHHEICNQTKEQKTCVVCTKLSDPQGTPVAEWKEQVQIPAGNTVSCSMHGTIRDPKCWSPEHPDLYGMETWYETTDEDGKKISYLADKQKVGIRVAEFDADRGFFLNGVPMKIKGVCVHHDAGCLGAAVTKEVWHRRFAKLKECGCNAIRCSHNPHMPELYASIEKRKPDIIIEDVFEINRRLKRDYSKGFYKFGIETVQFQYFFKDVMAQRSVEQGEYLPIEEIQSLSNKVLRIEALQPVIKNKYLKFNREHKTLIKQLTEFPMGKNDDGPDALQMAVQLAQSIKGIVTNTKYKSVIKRKFHIGKGAY